MYIQYMMRERNFVAGAHKQVFAGMGFSSHIARSGIDSIALAPWRKQVRILGIMV
jgi:hypothetical protein